MLGCRRLRNWQIIHDITRDAPGVSHQELHDFKPDWIPQGLEHCDQSFLVSAGDIQCAAGFWDGFIIGHRPLNRKYTMIVLVSTGVVKFINFPLDFLEQ